MAHYLVAGCQSTADCIKVHYAIHSLLTLCTEAPKIRASTQTGFTWLPTSFDVLSLHAMVASAEQSHMPISWDWILLWLFEI